MKDYYPGENYISHRMEPVVQSFSGECIRIRGNEVEHLRESLMEIAPGQNFMLVAFQVEDWNRDFSPWEAPAMFGTEKIFSGQGAETLRWLTEECMPYIDQTFDTERRERWLMGYSLAGLFALWAAYECVIAFRA